MHAIVGAVVPFLGSALVSAHHDPIPVSLTFCASFVASGLCSKLDSARCKRRGCRCLFT